MRCDAMRCDAMRCDAMRCDAMRCDAMRCDAMRCDRRNVRSYSLGGRQVFGGHRLRLLSARAAQALDVGRRWVDQHRAGVAVDREQVSRARPAEQAGHVADHRQVRGARHGDRGGATASLATRAEAPRATAAIAISTLIRSAIQSGRGAGSADRRAARTAPRRRPRDLRTRARCPA
ncbi:MAG: hypothetical protein IPQ07_32945 [Myxococcales bacterium]|nr:hypothetical protein [Myxococcales bacterium]